MEETAGAPSSFAALSPRRLRASSRDGGGVVNRPPSPLPILLSRHTRRREVSALIGAVACPAAARAQQQAGKVPRIGFLSLTSPSDRPPLPDAFRQGLRELGWVEGQNVVIDYRYAEDG